MDKNRFSGQFSSKEKQYVTPDTSEEALHNRNFWLRMGARILMVGALAGSLYAYQALNEGENTDTTPSPQATPTVEFIPVRTETARDMICPQKDNNHPECINMDLCPIPGKEMTDTGEPMYKDDADCRLAAPEATPLN